MRQRPVTVMTRDRPPDSPLEEFEQIYLRNVDVLMGYFAADAVTRRWSPT